MGIYYKVEDGQFVGFDKFQDGNHAVAIDFYNDSKTYLPKVRRVNFDKNDIQRQIVQVENWLDEKFRHVPYFPFSNPIIARRIVKFQEANNLSIPLFEWFLSLLKKSGITSFDDLFGHKSFLKWQNETPPSNKEEIVQFYSIMKLLIYEFIDLKR